MRPRSTDRPMDQSPIAVNARRQKCGIFVLRRHDDTEAFECVKALSESHRYTRSVTGVSCIYHCIFLHFRDIRYPGIFNSPQLFREILWTGEQSRFLINLPAIDSVYRTGSTQMGEPPSIFHPAQQQCRSIGQDRGPRIEDTIDGIGPIGCCQNRILGVSMEDL